MTEIVVVKDKVYTGGLDSIIKIWPIQYLVTLQNEKNSELSEKKKKLETSLDQELTAEEEAELAAMMS